MARHEAPRPGLLLRRTACSALVLTLGCFVVPTVVQGQGFSRSPGGELGASYQGLRRGSPGNAAPSDAVYRQWLKLPFRGSLLDPRIFAFDLSLNPGFTQRTSPGLPEALRSEELNYGVGIRILSAKPLSLTLASNRAAGNTSGGFGAQGDFKTTGLNGVLRFTNRLLPMELRYNRLSRENNWVSGLNLSPIQWSNQTRSFRFDARNRKTVLYLDRMEFKDRLGRSGFSSFDASIDHRLRWGKGSELQSSWDNNDRKGSLESLRRTWRERLRIQHTDGAFSNYNLARSRLRTPRGDRNTESFSAALRTRPTRWLGLGGQISQRQTRFNGSRDKTRGWGPDATVSFMTPAGGRITVSGAYGFERRDRIHIAGGVADVIDETHTVDATRSFLLESPHIELSSILVRDDDEDVIYTAEVEYRVVPVGDLVEIVILPGTRISQGQTLLISYRYRIPELPSGDLNTGRYSFVFSIKGVTLQHSRSLRDSEGENGQALLGFSTFDETRSGVTIDWNTPLGRFDLDARIRERVSSAFDFETAEISSSLAFPYWRGLQISVGGSGRRTRDDSGELLARSAYGAVLWSPLRQMQLSARVQLLELDLSEGGSDRTLGGYVNASLSAGRLEGAVRFEYDRRIQPREYSGGRVYVRLARRL